MKKILLVDNHFATQKVMECLLETYHFSTMVVCNYDNIGKIIIEDCPDMIILETEIAGRDGRLLCKEIKETAGLRFITIILSSSNYLQLKNFTHYKADGVLKKPFALHDLNVVLEPLTIGLPEQLQNCCVN